MGLCESVRGWRWQGSAGAFGAGLGVLLLGLCLAQSAPSQTTCPSAVAPQNLTQPQYQDTAEEDAGVGFMAAPVQSFLHTVQPNPFPKGQCHQYYSLIKHLSSWCDAQEAASTRPWLLLEDVYHCVQALAHRATRCDSNDIKIFWLLRSVLGKISLQVRRWHISLNLHTCSKANNAHTESWQDWLTTELMEILAFCPVNL